MALGSGAAAGEELLGSGTRLRATPHPADIALLAEMDRATGTLSGTAAVCVLRRQRDVSGDERFARPGSISEAHLYSKRKARGYREQRVALTKTSGDRASAIGVRKALAPEGRPGFLHIDSAHQGDFDGIKGLYRINGVDCVTLWEIVASVQTISEAHLLPVIEQFPFEIQGIHADDGSEYMNHRVARLLDKLRVEFTRSRPRASNDNVPAKPKNSAVVRKVFGYQHIPQRHAARFNSFCVEYLNPFPNFRRPCLFATDVPDPKEPGRIKRWYRPRDAMTPLDKFDSVPEAHKHLRAGTTLEHLHELARALTDAQAAT